MQPTATGPFPAAPAVCVPTAAPARAGSPQSVSSPAHDVIPVTRREGRGPEPLSLSKGPVREQGPAILDPRSPRPGSPAGAGPGSASGAYRRPAPDPGFPHVRSPAGIVGEGFKPSPTAWRHLRIGVRLYGLRPQPSFRPKPPGGRRSGEICSALCRRPSAAPAAGARRQPDFSASRLRRSGRNDGRGWSSRK